MDQGYELWVCSAWDMNRNKIGGERQKKKLQVDYYQSYVDERKEES